MVLGEAPALADVVFCCREMRERKFFVSFPRRNGRDAQAEPFRFPEPCSSAEAVARSVVWLCDGRTAVFRVKIDSPAKTPVENKDSKRRSSVFLIFVGQRKVTIQFTKSNERHASLIRCKKVRCAAFRVLGS